LNPSQGREKGERKALDFYYSYFFLFSELFTSQEPEGTETEEDDNQLDQPANEGDGHDQREKNDANQERIDFVIHPFWFDTGKDQFAAQEADNDLCEIGNRQDKANNQGEEGE